MLYNSDPEFLLVPATNTIQCESLVGQVAHPIFLICCGRASLLLGAFVQVGQCSWIVGYYAFRFCGWAVRFWPG